MPVERGGASRGPEERKTRRGISGERDAREILSEDRAQQADLRLREMLRVVHERRAVARSHPLCAGADRSRSPRSRAATASRRGASRRARRSPPGTTRRCCARILARSTSRRYCRCSSSASTSSESRYASLVCAMRPGRRNSGASRRTPSLRRARSEETLPALRARRAVCKSAERPMRENATGDPHAADFGVDARLFELVPGKPKSGSAASNSRLRLRPASMGAGAATRAASRGLPAPSSTKSGRIESRRRLRATRSLEQRGGLPAARRVRRSPGPRRTADRSPGGRRAASRSSAEFLDFGIRPPGARVEIGAVACTPRGPSRLRTPEVARSELAADLDHARARPFEFADRDDARRRRIAPGGTRGSDARYRDDFQRDGPHVEQRVLERQERQTRDAVAFGSPRPIVER